MGGMAQWPPLRTLVVRNNLRRSQSDYFWFQACLFLRLTIPCYANTGRNCLLSVSMWRKKANRAGDVVTDRTIFCHFYGLTVIGAMETVDLIKEFIPLVRASSFRYERNWST